MRRMIPQSLIDFIKGLAHPQGWLKMLKGSDNITVDESEDGKSVVVNLDQDVKDAISGNNEVVIYLEDEDYDEGNYVITRELNNTFFKIDPSHLTHYDENAEIWFRNPYMKGYLKQDTSPILVSYFAGYPTVSASEREIDMTPPSRSTQPIENVCFAIFNGILYIMTGNV